MKDLHVKSSPEVMSVFREYPNSVRPQMLALRKMILETAEGIDEITEIEETLKWSEPSYITKFGSTLRIDWKQKSPNQYAMYFQCSTRLVDTFKIIFRSTFQYEGKRAIIFQIPYEIPEHELKYCIKAALLYHKVKHLPTLGI
ncbi:uncharacterized protein DUF1801 [Gillisia mitskevichiae]|uniref:Uncharacterized protein DUF1801 n=1 Tax=Gillisia mitskevichiae TaxID=270921 RepID=A0A495PZU4_9FLAO|nr:DUF1801 domain-containing protein [Gillisia mitskevichiae]RKS56060.1 uncharacterized protein DUF1801 [Gillisia mitskevichiae]